MATFHDVLVVIDPTTDQQKALERAIELAEHCACRLTAFLSVYDFSYEMTTMLSGEERESMRSAVLKDREIWIEQLLVVARRRNIECRIEVVWHNRPFEAIVEAVSEHGYDLLIKGTHEHDELKSIIFTPTDWHILRKCPCPVLLVKEHAWPAQGNILVAINAGSDRPHHKALNHQLIAQGKAMAAMLHAQVHLVNAYPGTPVQIAVEIPEFDPTAYNNSMRHHHQDAAKALAGQFDITAEFVHVHEGMPEDVIPQVAKKLDAEMVIIGTIGRTGLSAAIIGNTAEHVIDRLDCDVLALKPDLTLFKQ